MCVCVTMLVNIFSVSVALAGCFARQAIRSVRRKGRWLVDLVVGCVNSVEECNTAPKNKLWVVKLHVCSVFVCISLTY